MCDYGGHDGVGPAAAELAWCLVREAPLVFSLASSALAFSRRRAGGYYRGANLEVELPDRLAVVHGVEGRNLVNAHGWHFQPACDFVHDADAGEAVLALAEIEEGHHGGFLIL